MQPTTRSRLTSTSTSLAGPAPRWPSPPWSPRRSPSTRLWSSARPTSSATSTSWRLHGHRTSTGSSSATAIVIALGRDGASRTIAFLGDLTLLHDANGLLIGPDEPVPDLTLVVLNDDGGAIFAGLEQGAPAYAPALERVFGTPHHTNLAAMCRAHGIAHERITQPERLAAVLGSAPSGIRLIEVPAARAERRAEANHLRDLAQSLWLRADPGPATGSERRPPS